MTSDLWRAPREHMGTSLRTTLDRVSWDAMAAGSLSVFVAHGLVLALLCAVVASLQWDPAEVVLPFVLAIGVAQLAYLVPIASGFRLASRPMCRALTDGLFLGAGLTAVVNGLGVGAMCSVGV